MKMGDSPDENVEAIPSGSIGLDLALGVGGYPRGELLKFMDRNPQERQH